MSPTPAVVPANETAYRLGLTGLLATVLLAALVPLR
jgi:hypothetical protein